ncbi:hypothetical protein RHMOL_Rhmol11G0191800 [Rhododendron molle]|uniref:Uncharacterized protein n=1 Tax=Rhododendron molle TaxID=49168 RepID=A0ACC0LUW4_RHOML|nr:hypothetical protein RHMOL_Rhmol11G0191800 [Rhododendron molle]
MLFVLHNQLFICGGEERDMARDRDLSRSPPYRRRYSPSPSPVEHSRYSRRSRRDRSRSPYSYTRSLSPLNLSTILEASGFCGSVGGGEEHWLEEARVFGKVTSGGVLFVALNISNMLKRVFVEHIKSFVSEQSSFSFPRNIKSSSCFPSYGSQQLTFVDAGRLLDLILWWFHVIQVGELSLMFEATVNAYVLTVLDHGQHGAVKLDSQSLSCCSITYICLHRRRSCSISPRRRRSPSPTPRRRKTRSPTPRRYRRHRSISTSLSPITKSCSPSTGSKEHKNAGEKVRKEDEEEKKRHDILLQLLCLLSSYRPWVAYLKEDTAIVQLVIYDDHLDASFIFCSPVLKLICLDQESVRGMP